MYTNITIFALSPAISEYRLFGVCPWSFVEEKEVTGRARKLSEPFPTLFLGTAASCCNIC